MIFSDSIPIKFWINGEETFNEKVICGVNQTCFCQPWNADDGIKIQFTDTEERGYKLNIIGTNGNTLQTLDFDRQYIGGVWVYSVSFIANDYSIDNEKIRFNISYFISSLSGGVTDYLELILGSFIEFVALSFVISGGVEDLIEELLGSISILAEIDINTNSSLDVTITDVKVDGVSATFISGTFPNGPGSGAVLSTKKTGTYDIDVSWSAAISGQHISLVGSDGTIFCENVGTGTGTVTFNNVVVMPTDLVTPFNPIQIQAEDGTC